MHKHAPLECEPKWGLSGLEYEVGVKESEPNRYGYTVATDSTSAIKVVTGSYCIKTTPDANRPAASLYAMGTFKQDYEYLAGGVTL